MERDCEACNFRESNIGYPSPCPAHEKKETSTTPNEREDWKEYMSILLMKLSNALGYGGKEREEIMEQIESLLSRTRQEERERVVEFIRNQFNLVVNVEPEEGMFSVHQMELEEILKEARKLT